MQIIEDKCAKSVKAAVNDPEVRISCVFFANPKIESAYFEIVKPKAAPVANAENNNLENTNPTNEQPSEQQQEQPQNEQNADSSLSTQEAAHEDIIKIESGGSHENYFFTIEEYGDGHSGLYEAVLKIKDVRAEDFRSFTLKITDNVFKTIKVLGNAECK